MGIDETPKIFVIFLASFLASVVATYQGVVSVDKTMINAARVLGARDLTIFLRVIVPASTPFILVGMRIGLGSAWATLVAAELIAAQTGLGYRMQQAQLYYDLADDLRRPHHHRRARPRSWTGCCSSSSEGSPVGRSAVMEANDRFRDVTRRFDLGTRPSSRWTMFRSTSRTTSSSPSSGRRAAARSTAAEHRRRPAGAQRRRSAGRRQAGRRARARARRDLPAVRAVPVAHRAPERRVRPAYQRRCQGRAAGAGRATSSIWSASATSPTRCRRRCRAA